MTAGPPDTDELRALAAAVRRVAMGRGLSRDSADDLAQETLTRLLASGSHLEPGARLPYALTTAGNLIVSLYRSGERARKHQHRLLEDRSSADPETDILALEQAVAVRAALNQLEAGDRQLLIDHAEGTSTAELAATAESTPGAVAARLARTRAQLRLDYLLALRRVTLPTVTCRRVLLAISAADKRRQLALNAAAHLAGCTTCVDLIPPLAERRSSLAGIAAAPLVVLSAVGRRIHQAVRSHPAQATAVTATAAGAVAVAIAVTNASHGHPAAAPLPTIGPSASSVSALPQPSPKPSDSVARTSSGVSLLPVPSAPALRRLAGQTVVVVDIPVQSVVSHPGFWIGTGKNRLYVQIADPEHTRRVVRAGRHVSFTGLVVGNPPGYAEAQGVTIPEGSALLTQQGVHLLVTAGRLVQQ